MNPVFAIKIVYSSRKKYIITPKNAQMSQKKMKLTQNMSSENVVTLLCQEKK